MGLLAMLLFGDVAMWLYRYNILWLHINYSTLLNEPILEFCAPRVLSSLCYQAPTIQLVSWPQLSVGVGGRGGSQKPLVVHSQKSFAVFYIFS